MAGRIFQSVAELTEVKDRCGGHNEHWNTIKERAVKSLEATCEPGPKTLLLDEPDQSLDIPSQANFWDIVGRNGRLQAIIATHSPFAMNIPGATYHDLSKGYLARCRETFAKHFKSEDV